MGSQLFCPNRQQRPWGRAIPLPEAEVTPNAEMIGQLPAVIASGRPDLDAARDQAGRECDVVDRQFRCPLQFSLGGDIEAIECPQER